MVKSLMGVDLTLYGPLSTPSHSPYVITPLISFHAPLNRGPRTLPLRKPSTPLNPTSSPILTLHYSTLPPSLPTLPYPLHPTCHCPPICHAALHASRPSPYSLTLDYFLHANHYPYIPTLQLHPSRPSPRCYSLNLTKLPLLRCLPYVDSLPFITPPLNLHSYALNPLIHHSFHRSLNCLH
jgi:hypothetical protein